MIKFTKKYKHELGLGIFALTYFIYFTTASFLRYTNYYTGRFDLGNMAQTVWNTIHGNFFIMTNPNGTEEVSRLAFHADFILILLAPFYLIWEDPRMLLLIQTFVLTFGGIFVYLIAKHVLKNKALALTFAICFYLNPALNYTNLYDFHAVTLATTFLLGAFYFILTKKWSRAVLFLFLAGITKEQVWAINVLIGIYIFFIGKQKTLGASVAILSGLIFYVLFWIVIPESAGSEHFALEFYSDYGDKPAEVIKNIILNPVDAVQTLLLPDRLSYIKQLFMPLGYLSIIAFPFLIFAAPDLVINILSNFAPMHEIYYQYSSTITPFIFLSAIYAAYFILKKFPEVPYEAIISFLLILTFISSYNYGPLPYAQKPNNAMFKKPLIIKNSVNNYINSISDDFIISASNNLGSHLSHRRQIFVLPLGIEKSDLVMFLLRNPNENEKKAFEDIQNNPNFGLEFREENFYVFKRISP